MRDEDGKFRLPRRALLLTGAAGAAALTLPMLLRGRHAVSAKVEGKNHLVIGFGQEPTVLNPHKLHVEVDEGVHYAIFDTLFFPNVHGLFEPGLAVEVPTVGNGGISKDGLNWRIRLRSGVTWHDGKPFTADDVRFTLQLIADPAFNAWQRSGHDLVRDIVVHSATEISWRMEKPLASYLSILAQTFILASHSFDGVADRNNAPIDAFPIGTGAFKFISRTPGDNITLAANHAYFGKGPYLEGVTYKYIPDATVIYTQFKAGDIDLVSQPWISPDNYREARALPGKIIEIIPSSTVECFAFNLGREPFQDPAVRQAIYYAVDKQSIIDVLNYGVPTATDSFVPQQSYYYNPALPKHVFDPARAREMLEETGWKLAADAIRVRDGKRLAFTNTTTSGDRIREEMQQFLQQSLRDIGIDMQIQNMPAAVLFSDFWMKSRFHSILHGQDYMVGADPDASEFFLSGKSQAKGGDGMNFWQYGNAQVDRLLAQGASNLDPQARRPLYRKIQQLIRDDLPFLPLYQKARVAGFVSDLRGYQGNVNVRIDCWNIDLWKRGG